MRTQELSDEQLADNFQQTGKDFYYEELVRRYRPALISFLAFYFAISAFAAEDLVQEAFLRALIGIGSFDAKRKWKTWLYRIAINAGNEILRRSGLENFELPEDISSSQLSLEKTLDLHFAQKKMAKAMAALPSLTRKILDLRYLQGLSVRQISLQEKIAFSAVKAQIMAGKKLLLAVLE